MFMFDFIFNILKNNVGKLVIASVGGAVVFTGVLIIAAPAIAAIAGVGVASGTFAAIRAVENHIEAKLNEEMARNKILIEEKILAEARLLEAQQRTIQNSANLQMLENQVDVFKQQVQVQSQTINSLHLQVRDLSSRDILPQRCELNGAHLVFAIPRPSTEAQPSHESGSRRRNISEVTPDTTQMSDAEAVGVQTKIMRK